MGTPEVPSEQLDRPKPGYYVLQTDGGIDAEQGQPSGRGSIGVVLKNPSHSTVKEISRELGEVQDHHVAEYTALIAGLELAMEHGIERLRVFIDSELVVNPDL